MSSYLDSQDLGFTADSLRNSRRLRSDQRQHWSSPYAAKRVHLVGVGGCGMSGLAGVLLRCGALVTGSDRSSFKTQARLEEMGASITIGHAPLNVPSDCDLVVYSAAIRDDNPEMAEAKRRGTARMKYAQMLGEVMRLRAGIAIAGTHGKSTTTALVTFILRQAKADPSFVVGADVEQLDGGSGVGDGPHFVVEACEFDRSFLNLLPRYAAILNIEEDHLDCFPDLHSITEAFKAFAALVPPDGVVIANGEDATVQKAVRNARGKVERFGTTNGLMWQAVNIEHTLGCYQFDILHDGEFHLHASLNHLPGRHHVMNALSAVALAHHAGIPADSVAASLSKFAGAERRFARRGEVGGVLLLDDYGHHPTEIQATLRAVREHYPGRRLWLIFQPHQHSRTRFLLEDFARSFGQADHLLVPDIYFVRDSAAERNAISSSHLVDRVRANGGDALYLPSHEQIVEHIVAHASDGDIVLTMGAGDVWKIADELVRRLG
ncbi:MAG TPA: UDP-N-acetylmuramate--L-alanine ligase [Phycisphaerae bacterium]|nr:UDP-N-acetylmuramate--L-alanine ligase [Phycisphaerae bacterium]